MEVIGWMDRNQSGFCRRTDGPIDRFVWSTAKDKAYRVSLRNTPQVPFCVLFLGLLCVSGVGLREGPEEKHFQWYLVDPPACLPTILPRPTSRPALGHCPQVAL